MKIYCYKKPIGCGRLFDIAEFEKYDDDTRREYLISGLCPKCQEEIFDQKEEVND